ncbi:MAG: peptidase [Candidatus Riflebacteria bacterium HGW-Riflebacteria-2]|jgi:serine protease Do|nr:MAG: peptidase [Candidatus Riflebacteria bacterium HGW-Riflebacteria-2]
MKFKLSFIVFAVFWLTAFLSPAVAAESGLEAAMSMQQAFVDVARSLKPSVVNIQVEKTVSAGIRWSNPSGGDPDNEFEDFFKHFFRGPRRFSPEEFKTQAAGSGLIINSDGTILTNNHVVKDASKIKVKLHDGSELDAEIIGQDPQTDLAVIRVKSEKALKAAEFADSDKVEAGQWSIAVGNPLGLEQTVTVGVVSAVGRSGIGASAIEDFIQTDASINPGNSGGPLVNLNAKVIGINTLIFNAPGSGIGFAIPSNMASRIASQIASGGKVERPYIGISMQAVTDELAGHFGLKDRDGAVVMDTAEDAPADKAGIRAMDIIRKIDDRLMKSTNDVQKYILSRGVGSSVDIEVLRNGKKETYKVTLEQMPDNYGLSPAESVQTPSKRKGDMGQLEEFGFRLQKLTPEMARSLGITGSAGVVVTNVRSGSPADKAGLKSGDVITQINGVEIQEESEAENALKEGGRNNSSVFLVNRSGTPMFLVIQSETKD